MATHAGPLVAWKVDASEYPPDGDAADVLRFAVSYAILAPSGHNTQPWLFGIHGDTLALYADRSRALPVADPHDRELTLSCGAALLTLRVALARFGHAVDVDVLPEGADSDLMATVSLVDLPAQRAPHEEALFEAATRRHTNRRAYASTPVPAGVTRRLVESVVAEGAWLHVVEGAERQALVDLVVAGDRMQMAQPSFRRELAAWMRGNHSARSDGIRGASYGYSDVRSAVGPVIVRTFDVGKGQAAYDQHIAEGSPLLVVLGTNAETPSAWLAAGQAMQRMLLTATAHGLVASYLNQPVEVADLRPRLAETVGRPAGLPQLVMRLGYGSPVPPSPRRPLEDVLLS